MKRNLNMKSGVRTKKVRVRRAQVPSIDDKEIKQDQGGQGLILGVEPLLRQEGRNTRARFIFNSIIPNRTEISLTLLKRCASGESYLDKK